MAALGSFPLRIIWRKGILAGGISDLPPYEDTVLLEVRDRSEGDRLIYTIHTAEDCME